MAAGSGGVDRAGNGWQVGLEARAAGDVATLLCAGRARSSDAATAVASDCAAGAPVPSAAAALGLVAAQHSDTFIDKEIKFIKYLII